MSTNPVGNSAAKAYSQAVDKATKETAQQRLLLRALENKQSDTLELQNTLEGKGKLIDIRV